MQVDFINATLGTSSYKIEQGDSDSDGIYYESEFDNVEDLVKAKEQLAAENFFRRFRFIQKYRSDPST